MSDLSTLERDAARARQTLAQSLDALSGATSPDNIQNHASALAQSYGGDLGNQAWGAAKQNPAAFALVGAGLSLLLTGTGSRPEARAPKPTLVPTQDAYEGFDARVAAAEEKMTQEARTMENNDTAPRAIWLREKMNEGLDALPEDARKRVLEARTAALRAQEKVEAKARATAKKSQTFLHDQPLAVGAIALGLGALIGAVLPSTRREDDLLGAHRDAVMAQARAALNDEIKKAGLT